MRGQATQRIFAIYKPTKNSNPEHLKIFDKLKESLRKFITDNSIKQLKKGVDRNVRNINDTMIKYSKK